MAKNPKIPSHHQPSDQINYHKQFAMGLTPKGYSHGGVTSQESGKPEEEHSGFQKYGMGYRRIHKPK